MASFRKWIGKWAASLQFKLLLSYLVISVVPILFIAHTVYQTLDKHFIREQTNDLLRQASIISTNISLAGYLNDDSGANQVAFNSAILGHALQGNFRILILDKNGVVVNDSNKIEAGKTLLVSEVIAALEGEENIVVKKPDNIIYVLVSIKDSVTSETTGIVFISANMARTYNTIDSLVRQVNILSGVTLCIVALMALIISHIITEPLKNVMNAISKMAQGHLEYRTKVYSHDEIGQLGMAINNMAARLEQLETSRQTFVSNVSHELKTPLSSIKVLSESMLFQEDVPKEMYIEFLQDINSEIDRMSDIITDLLELVKLDQKDIPMAIAQVNITALVGDIIKRLTPLGKIKNVEITYEANKDVTADIDKMKFTLAISNLIENGIKYTQDGGYVKVTVDSDHQNAFITVTDDGIGIAEEDIDKIFERFYRVDKTRARQTGGTGLGLSITHSTVMLHKGSIKVISKENEGSSFVVRIPLQQSGQ